jgi:O-antigen/teichoic acid export membrane protein
MGIVPLFGGYYLVVNDLLTVLASSKYEEASTFSPLIVIGTVLLGLNNVFNAGLYLNKRSGTMLFIMLTAAGVNIGFNLILVPKYGLMGAATSTLVACLVSVILTLIFSCRYLTVKVDVRTMIYSMLVTGAMVMLVREIRIDNAFVSLTTKVFSGTAFVLAGFLCTQHADRNKIINYLKLRVQEK